MRFTYGRQKDQSKEIPIADPWYPIRTCGWKNRKKINKRITKALMQGEIGSWTGCAVYRPINEEEFAK